MTDPSLGQPRVNGAYSTRTLTTPDPSVEFVDRPGDRYIVVEGGLVQNTPKLPVIDLDFLKDSGVSVSQADAEAIAVQCAELGLREDAERVVRWMDRQRELIGAGEFTVDDLPDEIQRTDAEDGDLYILVEGGIVQNEPALPIIYLDFLESGGSDVDEKEDAEKIAALCDDFGLDAHATRIHQWIALNFTDQP